MKAPFANLNFRCKPKKTSINKMGISAGKSIKLSQNSPFSKAMIERWKPHPGHSTPKYCL